MCAGCIPPASLNWSFPACPLLQVVVVDDAQQSISMQFSTGRQRCLHDFCLATATSSYVLGTGTAAAAAMYSVRTLPAVQRAQTVTRCVGSSVFSGTRGVLPFWPTESASQSFAANSGG